MRRPRVLVLAVCSSLAAAYASAAHADDNVVQQPITQPAPAAQPAPAVVQPASPAQPSGAVVQQTNVTTDGDESKSPSIFLQGVQGLFAGAAVGAAGGYLVGRRDDWERSDWRAVGLGIGIGSLTGGALGLSLGFASDRERPAGRYIARDMVYGAGFGATVGAISGGISAAINDDPEHVLAGAAIGLISGAGVGIITGIVEGQTRETTTVRQTSRFRIVPNLALARAVDGSNAVTPGVFGRF